MVSTSTPQSASLEPLFLNIYDFSREFVIFSTRLEDPVVRAFRASCSVLIKLKEISRLLLIELEGFRVFGVSEADRKKLRDATHLTTRAFRSVTRRTEFFPGAFDGAELANLLAETALDSCQRDAAMAMADFFAALGSTEESEELLTQFDVLYAEFKTQLKLVTQEKLTLQSHLEAFVSYGWPDNSSTPDAVLLYQPLLELRDRYFASPTNELLLAYCAMAQEIDDSFTYRLLKFSLERRSEDGDSQDKANFKAVNERLERRSNELAVLQLWAEVS
jgi:hypothetical protein